MVSARWIWRLWFAMGAAWLAIAGLAAAMLSGPESWLERLASFALHGAAPVFAGTVLIYWSIMIAPWWRRPASGDRDGQSPTGAPPG